MPRRAVLEEVALRVDCGVVEEGDVLRVVRLSPEELEVRRMRPIPPAWMPREAGPGTVTCEFQDQLLETVLEPVRRASGENIIVAYDLAASEPRLSLRLTEVPWQQALLEIAGEIDSVVWVIGSEYLRIDRAGPGPRRAVSRKFRECAWAGGRFRDAEKAGDAAGMAEAKRYFLSRAVPLEREVREFPGDPRYGAGSWDPFTPHNLQVNYRKLRSDFRDIFEEK
jgi:type II secretory pathway component GspD/PulD (secretin)